MMGVYEWCPSVAAARSGHTNICCATLQNSLTCSQQHTHFVKYHKFISQLTLFSEMLSDWNRLHLSHTQAMMFFFFFPLARLSSSSSRVPPPAHLPARPPSEWASAPVGERKAIEEQLKLQGPRSEQQSCNSLSVRQSRAVSDPSHAASGLFSVPNVTKQGISSLHQLEDWVKSDR